MCDTCERILRTIERAETDGNIDKVRVLRSVYSGHLKTTHCKTIVCISSNFIVWPGGSTWIVAR